MRNLLYIIIILVVIGSVVSLFGSAMRGIFHHIGYSQPPAYTIVVKQLA